ncbi:hypothetical protein AB0O22_17870 [Streptomyces sp. NPDC091204]|uniref:hypothetical protein n=1 Tax=Streptomyces sp. NPDC091204 TaxID=3155299 RepID=UPI0034304D2D
MDIVQWLPGLTGMTAIGAALITSRTAIRTAGKSNSTAVEAAERTARVSLHTTYTAPRIKAVTDFLEAVETGRNDRTEENLTKARTAYLTLRVLAFEETSEAVDVKDRARALTKHLRAVVENLPSLSQTPAEIARQRLESATRSAEDQDDDARDSGVDMTSERARAALERTADLQYALDLVQEIQARDGTATEEESAELHRLGFSLGMPDLDRAVEPLSERLRRKEARAAFSTAHERLWKDRRDFAEAVARWLNAGPPQ